MDVPFKLDLAKVELRRNLRFFGYNITHTRVTMFYFTKYQKVTMFKHDFLNEHKILQGSELFCLPMLCKTISKLEILRKLRLSSKFAVNMYPM